MASGHRHVLIAAPTGAGKTHILAWKLASFLERRSDGVALYVVHRRQLVLQTHALLERLGIPASIVMADHVTDWSNRVFVVSRDTWERRKKYLNFGDVGLVIFDEAHIGISAQLRIAEALRPEVVLGYTATPVSMNGPGMGALYQTLIQGPSYMELISDGFLVPTRFVSVKMDTSELRVNKMTGDYVTADVVGLVKGQVLADLYEAYAQYAGKRTVIFAPTVDIAWTIAARFGNMGIRAAALDWSTKPKVREGIFKEFKDGTLPIIVNVDVLSEGWDEPLVDTIVLANPTRSLARYLQRIGRGMRIAPGKAQILIVDLVGSLYEHGAPEDIISWELEEARPDRRAKPGEALVKRRGVCPICHEEMKGNKCKCGFEASYLPTQTELEVVPLGRLEWMDESWFDGPETRMVFYRQLLGYALERGFKPGWAAHAYREKYKTWPDYSWKEYGPLEPGEDAKRWAKHLFIKRHKKQPIEQSLWRRRQ